MDTDILIAGSGCAGLYCALHLPKSKKITIITKSEIKKSDSYLAQGGICVLKDDFDFDLFMEDTLKAGHYENDRNSVSIMIKSSRDIINDLVNYGVNFTKDNDGNFIYTKEGAHSQNRILFHQDITGKEITDKLLNQACSRDNITILENTTLLDIIKDNNECFGAIIAHPDGTIEAVKTEHTILACGGIGGIFKHSTNYKHLTGDGVAIAIKNGVKTQDLNYIQIHPTTLFTKETTERSFLISESVRGEGAKLYNKNMQRFVNELLPRDCLTDAIHQQMKKDNSEHVWEDLRTINDTELTTHFPNIVNHCKEKGYDIKKECIPVVPAQHYFMGGIKVDYNSKTSMERLYAIGETACNGVHGKNRLASNSLLESLVFAKRAAQSIANSSITDKLMPEYNLAYYTDRKKLENEYKTILLKEIGEKYNV